VPAQNPGTLCFRFWSKKRELSYNREVWQKGYNDHRIRDADDYAKHVEYVWMNPVKAGIVERPEELFVFIGTAQKRS